MEESRRAPQPLTDLELLELQAEMVMDAQCRLVGVCGVTIAAACQEHGVFVGSEVPDGLVPALVEAVRASSLASAPDAEPPALGACREILEPACGPLALRAGPYYLFEHPAQLPERTGIARSDLSPTVPLRSLNPGNWEEDEWDDLLDGALGPWAMALAGGRVVSVCHTPRPMTERAAECGVWTHPDYRGRGFAAAVTATWADVLRPSGRYLFYNADRANLSSQRVAARLGLRPIGWVWHLATASHEPLDTRHPLSRPRHRKRIVTPAPGGRESG